MCNVCATSTNPEVGGGLKELCYYEFMKKLVILFLGVDNVCKNRKGK